MHTSSTVSIRSAVDDDDDSGDDDGDGDGDGDDDDSDDLIWTHFDLKSNKIPFES